VEVPARSTDQIQALEIKKPIIAAVNGAVAGLGFVLALSADVRFCTADSKWTTAFAKRGTLADSATRFTMLHSPATARPMHARQYCSHLQHYTQDRTNRVLVK
jgi:enoyl-CoA hydratase/carnithine racemase